MRCLFKNVYAKIGFFGQLQWGEIWIHLNLDYTLAIYP